MMTKNVIVWGTGGVYHKYSDRIRYFCDKNEINCLGIVSGDDDIAEIDGIRFIRRSELDKIGGGGCVVDMHGSE